MEFVWIVLSPYELRHSLNCVEFIRIRIKSESIQLRNYSYENSITTIYRNLSMIEAFIYWVWMIFPVKFTCLIQYIMLKFNSMKCRFSIKFQQILKQSACISIEFSFTWVQGKAERNGQPDTMRQNEMP